MKIGVYRLLVKYKKQSHLENMIMIKKFLQDNYSFNFNI